jgi:hypothetical protein
VVEGVGGGWSWFVHCQGACSCSALGLMVSHTCLAPALPSQPHLPPRVHTNHRTSTTGYLRLHTSLGDLNIELHCDIAPRTCENFLGLCEMGYYDDTPFHRSIKNFMIQVC